MWKIDPQKQTRSYVYLQVEYVDHNRTTMELREGGKEKRITESQQY
jgi:hypothetical protein